MCTNLELSRYIYLCEWHTKFFGIVRDSSSNWECNVTFNLISFMIIVSVCCERFPNTQLLLLKNMMIDISIRSSCRCTAQQLHTNPKILYPTRCICEEEKVMACWEEFGVIIRVMIFQNWKLERKVLVECCCNGPGRPSFMPAAKRGRNIVP